MIFRKKDLVSRKKGNPMGGAGILNGLFAVCNDRPVEESRFNMIGQMVLEPGSLLGEHCHDDNEEAYIIISGNGIYDNNGEKVEVGPGDVTLTLRGESHSLANKGDVPLRFIAVIVE